MESRNTRHTIDFLFPAALFLLFAGSALCVMLLAARIYQSTAAGSPGQSDASTALSYISEKLHQSDREGAISPGELDGCEALILKHTSGADTYTTYIYVWEQELRELFIRDGVEPVAADGRGLLPLAALSMEEIKPGTFLLTCTDATGTAASAAVSVRSREPSPENPSQKGAFYGA